MKKLGEHYQFRNKVKRAGHESYITWQENIRQDIGGDRERGRKERDREIYRPQSSSNLGDNLTSQSSPPPPALELNSIKIQYRSACK